MKIGDFITVIIMGVLMVGITEAYYEQPVVKEVILVSDTKPAINLLEGLISLDKPLVRYGVLDKLARWTDENGISGFYRIHAYGTRGYQPEGKRSAISIKKWVEYTPKGLLKEIISSGLITQKIYDELKEQESNNNYEVYLVHLDGKRHFDRDTFIFNDSQIHNNTGGLAIGKIYLGLLDIIRDRTALANHFGSSTVHGMPQVALYSGYTIQYKSIETYTPMRSSEIIIIPLAYVKSAVHLDYTFGLTYTWYYTH